MAWALIAIRTRQETPAGVLMQDTGAEGCWRGGYGCSQSDLQGETDVAARHRPWHFLNFLPLPQGQGSLRPTFSDVRWTGALRTAGSSPRFSVIRTGCRRLGVSAGRSPLTACTWNNLSS